MIRGAFVTLLALCAPAAASAQLEVVAGGGPSVPLRSFGDIARVGGLGFVGAELWLAAVELAVGVEAAYGHNAHEIAGNRSALYGVRATARYSVARIEGVEISVRAEFGALVHERRSDAFPGLDSSERGVAAGLGAGVALPLARVTPFVYGSYTTGLGSLDTSAFPTELAEVRAGVRVPLGP